MTAPVSGSRILGLDPGEVRIGVALSDPLGIIAQPHAVLDRRHGKVTEELRQIVNEHDVGLIVVGLPIGLSGGEGPAAARARELGVQVAENLGVSVEYYDERFTTVQAEAALLESGMRRDGRRARRDMVAAALMLQAYLDRPGAGTTLSGTPDEGFHT
jgi:putative Holliday junction resolvase